ncbi:unnamed protein product [Cylicostephanus goldi]|uniref:Uncharacterized protein n=1 Tax=Cylicostephanus goldi TaxID=71465 RepID=A0A3P6T310_CYLGO|nr:unnamed protein product [Cylicostephanus goldi]
MNTRQNSTELTCTLFVSPHGGFLKIHSLRSLRQYSVYFPCFSSSQACLVGKV